MTITIDGSTGIASVDGSAGSPSVRGTDANSGILYTSDAIKFSTGGTQRAVIDNNGLSSAGHILQVVSRFQSSAKSTGTSGSFVDVSDVYGTITPASSSNKILVLINGTVSSASGISVGFGLNRTISGSISHIAQPDTADLQSGIQNLYAGNENHILAMNYHFLDSPSTTNEITYQLTWRNSSGTTYWNRYEGSSSNYNSTSSVILMEVAG